MHKNNCNLGVVYGKEINAKINSIKEMVKNTRQEVEQVVRTENEKRRIIEQNAQDCISEIEKRKNERLKELETEHQLRMDKLEELKIAIEKKDEEEINRIMKQLY